MKRWLIIFIAVTLAFTLAIGTSSCKQEELVVVTYTEDCNYDKITDCTELAKQTLKDMFERYEEETGVKFQKPVVIEYKSPKSFIFGSEFYAVTQQNKIVITLPRDEEEDIYDAIIEYVFAHETMHLFIHQLVGEGDLPLWVDEGLAIRAGREISWPSVYENYSEQFGEVIKDNSFLSLDELYSRERAYSSGKDQETVWLCIGFQSESLINYLIESHGTQKMWKYLAAFKEGHNYKEGLKKVYNLTPEELEKNWQTKEGIEWRKIEKGKLSSVLNL